MVLFWLSSTFFALCAAVLLLLTNLAAISEAATNDSNTLPVTLLGQRAALLIKNRLLRRQERVQSRAREICYDMVGCFPAPRTQISPLKKSPQPPETVDTKFFLLTRAALLTNTSYVLKYGDNQKSLIQANFDGALPTKLIIHGFKGSGQDRGAQDIASAFLDLENANIVLVDWQKGAAGPSYIAAAANTQLVGRQIALLLMDMVSVGLDPSNLHIVGFSLGAHIAGYAGRAIQKKKLKVGRITGLDPANPLFRELLSTSLSPLHKNDAKFVDIIHTDGARFLNEGLGIFRPIGHVDYFPNGGFDQPGCNHVRGAVIASHIGGSLDTGVVCNHLRAWQLFLESLKSWRTGCEFLSYPCAGGWNSFEKGNCFSSQCNELTCSKMGYSANESRYLGPLFLVTRDSAPYCGEQLHVSVTLSSNMPTIRGDMRLSLLSEAEATHFQLHSDLRDELQGGDMLHGVGAAPFGLVSPEKMPSIIVHISCHIINQKTKVKRNALHIIAVDEVVIKNLRGNSWRYFKPSTALGNVNGTTVEAVTVELKIT